MNENHNEPWRPTRFPLTVEAMLKDVLEKLNACPKSEDKFWITPTSEFMGDLCSRLLCLESQITFMIGGTRLPDTMFRHLEPHKCDVCKPKRKRKVK